MLIKSARSENEFFLKLFYNKRMRHVLIILLSAVFISANAFAAPKAELWARWQKHDSKSAVTLSHKAWDDFLNAISLPPTAFICSITAVYRQTTKKCWMII